MIEKSKERHLMEVDLISKLSRDREFTQEELAAVTKIRQPAISQIENQEDVLVKTLERYVKALGGQLKRRAKFSNKIVRLTQFGNGKRVGAPSR